MNQLVGVLGQEGKDWAAMSRPVVGNFRNANEIVVSEVFTLAASRRPVC
jgi:hypothetical protein